MNDAARHNANFLADLSEWVDLTCPKAVVLAQRKVVLDFFAAVIDRSPVDTGRYRASHTAQFGTPDESVAPEQPKAKGGNPRAVLAPARARFDIPNAGWEGLGVVWVGNHLPYAERLEDGHSQQQPEGVYFPALSAFQAVPQEVIP